MILLYFYKLITEMLQKVNITHHFLWKTTFYVGKKYENV